MIPNTETISIGTTARRVPAGVFCFDDLPDSAYVNAATVCILEGGISPPTLRRRIIAGLFPPAERKSGPSGLGTREWTVGLIRRVHRGEWRPTNVT